MPLRLAFTISALYMPSAPSYLSSAGLDTLINRALEEDLHGEGASLEGDVTTEATVPSNLTASAHLQAKEAGTVAGLAVAARVFGVVDEALAVSWQVDDGARVEPGTTVGRVAGRARSLLIAERLALNVLQRMSGIATATRRMVELARPHGTKILDTRKTAPGLRALDKWAVRLGGGTNHRLGLYDRILIKDNHLAAAGGIEPALDAAHEYRQRYSTEDTLKIELETRTLDEVHAALDAAARRRGPDIVLLDNMARPRPDGAPDVSQLREAVALIDGRFETEASGNVTLQTVEAIAQTGVDAISSGALTHSVRALDLSIEISLD